MWEGRLEDVSSETLRTYKQDGTLSLLINSAHLTSTPCHPSSHAFVTNMPREEGQEPLLRTLPILRFLSFSCHYP